MVLRLITIHHCSYTVSRSYCCCLYWVWTTILVVDQMGIRLISVEMDWAWQKMCVQKLLFQILSRHLSDTVLILFRHCLDIAWLIYEVCCNFSCGWIQYLSETVHILSGQCEFTVRHCPDGLSLAKNVCTKTSVSNTFQTPFRHCPDTVLILFRHCPDTV